MRRRYNSESFLPHMEASLQYARSISPYARQRSRSVVSATVGLSFSLFGVEHFLAVYLDVLPGVEAQTAAVSLDGE